MPRSAPTSIRLSQQIQRLLTQIQERTGESRTTVIERAVRALAREEQRMPDTIPISFDPAADLPEWAQGNEAIIARARRDLAFRADVWQAETEHLRAFLAREAERQHPERES